MTALVSVRRGEGQLHRSTEANIHYSICAEAGKDFSAREC